MFEQTFKNIDDVLWKEAGCSSELDYVEQTSWMLFLKYLDDLEEERAMEAELKGRSYQYVMDNEHRWAAWAAPKKADGSFDHDNALTGDDLIAYVNQELFPYLKGFKRRASGSDTLEYKIGEIFGEIPNKFRSGYSLRDALEYVDTLHFRSQEEKHELSVLYEAKIQRMGNAGRNGGEYYTPRPLIRAMIQVTRPQIGERVYDGACGSAGFLCEAYDFMRGGHLTTDQLDLLKNRTFYGKEKKSLAYVIAIMNIWRKSSSCSARSWTPSNRGRWTSATSILPPMTYPSRIPTGMTKSSSATRRRFSTKSQISTPKPPPFWMTSGGWYERVAVACYSSRLDV